MLAIAGTVPMEDFPVTVGEVTLDDDHIVIQDYRVPVNRGTPALMAAALEIARTMGNGKIFGYLAGDIGLGEGSRRLYEYISNNIQTANHDVITFHYLQPDSDWHNRVLFAVEKMKKRPVLIADAGFMYAAKMSGQASEYDLFTPDAGELAFLADEEAPHPFYTRGFILHEDNHTPDLIKRAYKYDNASKYLLVKGKTDYMADRHGIINTVESPSEETMEPIGGTGDTLTGIVSALIASGMNIPDAGILAAGVNRLAGHYAKPDPSTQIIEIIRNISRSVEASLSTPA